MLAALALVFFGAYYSYPLSLYVGVKKKRCRGKKKSSFALNLEKAERNRFSSIVFTYKQAL